MGRIFSFTSADCRTSGQGGYQRRYSDTKTSCGIWSMAARRLSRIDRGREGVSEPASSVVLVVVGCCGPYLSGWKKKSSCCMPSRRWSRFLASSSRCKYSCATKPTQSEPPSKGAHGPSRCAAGKICSLRLVQSQILTEEAQCVIGEDACSQVAVGGTHLKEGVVGVRDAVDALEALTRLVAAPVCRSSLEITHTPLSPQQSGRTVHQRIKLHSNAPGAATALPPFTEENSKRGPEGKGNTHSRCISE